MNRLHAARRGAARLDEATARAPVSWPPAEAGGGPLGAVRRYDFRVPDKFPKDVLRQVGHLYDGMARTLTTSLSAQLRATVRVERPQPVQATYAEFVAGCNDPGILAAFAADPLPGSALLEIDPVIGFPMIDRLLGGSGDLPHGLQRPVTEIELTVIQRIVTTVLDNWREAWGHVAALAPRVLGLETNPLFVQLAAPGDIVLGVSLTCGLGRSEGLIRFCLPHAMLEPVLRRLAARDWSQAAREPPGARRADLERGLEQVEVAVQVELGRVRRRLSEVWALRVGDVLPLGVSVHAPARVYVAGLPRFRGHVGLQGNRLAVRIAAVEEG